MAICIGYHGSEREIKGVLSDIKKNKMVDLKIFILQLDQALDSARFDKEAW